MANNNNTVSKLSIISIPLRSLLVNKVWENNLYKQLSSRGLDTTSTTLNLLGVVSNNSIFSKLYVISVLRNLLVNKVLEYKEYKQQSSSGLNTTSTTLNSLGVVSNNSTVLNDLLSLF
jgi:hypothetical protein